MRQSDLHFVVLFCLLFVNDLLVWQKMYYVVVAGAAWNSFREPYEHPWGVYKLHRGVTNVIYKHPLGVRRVTISIMGCTVNTCVG